MFNQVTLLGNLTRNIELKYTQSGTAIGSTGIATTRKYKGADGQQKEDVMFIDITFFGRTAEIANQYLRKGSKVFIVGTLKLDQWQDANGQKKSKHSVTVNEMKMLSTNQQGQGQAQPQQQPQPAQQYQQPMQQQPQPAQGTFSEMDIDDDEIPF